MLYVSKAKLNFLLLGSHRLSESIEFKSLRHNLFSSINTQ